MAGSMRSCGGPGSWARRILVNLRTFCVVGCGWEKGKEESVRSARGVEVDEGPGGSCHLRVHLKVLKTEDRRESSLKITKS